MASFSRVALVLLLIFVITIELQVEGVAGKRTCKARSHKFKGHCGKNANCKAICKTEGFEEGSCHHHVLKKRCFCEKPC